MPTTADGTWFGIFPAQANYDNTPEQQRDALHALLPHAKTADVLRDLAVTLGIIEPPAPEVVVEVGPDLCPAGHDQAIHRKKHEDACRACARTTDLASLEDRGMVDPTGSVRRVRHLLLNGHSIRQLAALSGVSVATITRMSHGQTKLTTPETAHLIRVAFDEHRDDFYNITPHWSHAATRRDWVWAELYEDLDDPNCQPVIPKAVAA